MVENILQRIGLGFFYIYDTILEYEPMKQHRQKGSTIEHEDVDRNKERNEKKRWNKQTRTVVKPYAADIKLSNKT